VPRPRTRRMTRAFDEPRAKAPPASQPCLQAGHAPVVVGRVVIVAEKMKQAVKREDLELRGVRVAGGGRLTACDAGRDDEIAEKVSPRLRGPRSGRRRERQDVRRLVFSTVAPVESADLCVAREGDGYAATRPRGRHGREPLPQPRRAYRTASAVRHRDEQPATVGIHRTLRRPSRSAARVDGARRPSRRNVRKRFLRSCRRSSPLRRGRTRVRPADRSASRPP